IVACDVHLVAGQAVAQVDHPLQRVVRVLALRVLLDHLPEGGEGLAGGARGALREVGAEEVLDQIRRALEVDQPLDVISIVDARMSGILASTIDRKSTRLNSSHQIISYAVFCLKKKKK